ncbi:MAG: STAS/SEC14 domain-containing protein [Thiohalocapsa sp.]|nr:STAS/SEC14 domain-containing protein [Thiohalocapsa sp.]MCF7990144.1 STAS/SEC14 domain-containing protein [Thiohalocapsa sp.]
MVKIRQEPGTNIVEMEIEGAMTAQEFDDALAQFKSAIDEHGSIRVLEIIGSLGTPPVPWSKFWEDVKFGFEHLGDISHAAVVADQGWIGIYTKMLDPLLKAEIKWFKRSDLPAAREWLKTSV